MDVVGKHLNEPLVQRVLITDWLELPAATVMAMPASTGPPLASAALSEPAAAH
jgi:hypothetical protein